MIGVINLGNSNLMSMLNSLDFLHLPYRVITAPEELDAADRILLPGVGTFGNGVAMLHRQHLYHRIKEEVLGNHKPILGVCLGMQLLYNSSAESEGAEGLGLLAGEVRPLPPSDDYTIPRIGWAQSRVVKPFFGFEPGTERDFYYIHSFYVEPADRSEIAIATETDITAAISREHIFGCQFHPEKSHKAGLDILKRFAEYSGCAS